MALRVPGVLELLGILEVPDVTGVLGVSLVLEVLGVLRLLRILWVLGKLGWGTFFTPCRLPFLAQIFWQQLEQLQS